MPLSFSAVSKLGRIIGLALVLLALGACSLVRLTYDQAPNLAYWWLDGYVDINGEQTPKVRDAMERWFAWHRRTQLPQYAALLARAQRDVTEPTTAAALCTWTGEAERQLDAALEGAVPAAAELMLTLTPEQLQHIERRFAKGTEETRADFLQGDPAERKAAALKRTVARFENLYGRLGETQRERLAGLLARSSFDAERWLAERYLRQRELLQTLAAVSSTGRSGGDRAAAVQQAQAAARLLIERTTRSPRANYRAYQQRLVQDNCALVATMHNAMSAAQRQAARAKLKGWEDDLRSLVAAGSSGGGAATNAAASR